MARRHAFARTSHPPQEPVINITPLVDVVFVLLISFMVIAPLLELDRIELASGNNLSTHLPVHFEDTSPIQIHVYEDNRIALNNQTINLQELTLFLHKAKQQFPDARAQLFHHKRAYFGTYQAVKNALEAADFKELDVVLSPSI